MHMFYTKCQVRHRSDTSTETVCDCSSLSSLMQFWIRAFSVFSDPTPSWVGYDVIVIMSLVELLKKAPVRGRGHMGEKELDGRNSMHTKADRTCQGFYLQHHRKSSSTGNFHARCLALAKDSMAANRENVLWTPLRALRGHATDQISPSLESQASMARATLPVLSSSMACHGRKPGGRGGKSKSEHEWSLHTLFTRAARIEASGSNETCLATYTNIGRAPHQPSTQSVQSKNGRLGPNE